MFNTQTTMLAIKVYLDELCQLQRNKDMSIDRLDKGTEIVLVAKMEYIMKIKLLSQNL